MTARANPAPVARLGWLLLRRDPAWRSLWQVILISAVLGIVIRAGAGAEPPDLGGGPLVTQPGRILAQFVMTWLWFFWATLITNFWTRSSRLALAMPLSPRRVWPLRAACQLAMSLLPVALVTLAVAQRGWRGGLPLLDAGTVRLGVRVWGVLALFQLAAQLPARLQHRIPARPAYVAYIAALAAGSLWLTLVSPPHPGFLAGLLGAVLLTGACNWWCLPTTWSLTAGAPAMPDGDSRAGRARDAAGCPPARSEAQPASVMTSPVRRSGGRWLRWRTILGVLHAHPLAVILLLILTYYGFLLVEDLHTPRNMLPFILLAAALLWGVLGQSVGRLHRLDPLPISRSRLFAAAVLPPLACLALGFGAGELRYRLAPYTPTLVGYWDRQVQVPREFWCVAPAGEVPLVRAPWGEAHRPAARPLTRLGGTMLYHPYEHGEASSPAFIDWQIWRAIADVHGVRAPASISDPDRPLSPGYLAAIARGGFTPDASVGLGSAIHARTRALGACLAALGAGFLLAIGLGHWSPRNSSWRRLSTILATGLPVALMIALVIGGASELVDIGAMGALVLILVRNGAEALALPAGVLWALAPVCLVLGLWIAQERFARIEIPPRLSRRRFHEEY